MVSSVNSFMTRRPNTNAKKEVTYHSLYQIRYTKYNSLGLPVAGIQTERKRQQSFTIEYTFY